MSQSAKSGLHGRFLSLKDEQERMQKKTFTKWINSYLTQLNPPVIVKDIFTDLKDGILLLDLLELLTKMKMVKEKPKVIQRIHCISNVKTALEFMENEKKIKMVNINPSDIVDGKPSIVLGLMWTLVLFTIEEQKEFLLHALGMDTDSGAPVKGMAKKALMAWSNNALSEKYGLDLKDFGESWRDGKAFNALVHNINPDLIDLDEMEKQSNKERLDNAFNIAENELGIYKLLDSEDVDVSKPDEKSIMTYVAQFLRSYPEGKKTEDPDDFIDAKVQNQAMAQPPELSDWDKIQVFNENVNSDIKNPDLKNDYSAFSELMDQKYDIVRALNNIRDQADNETDLKDLEESFIDSEKKLKKWQWDLDKNLPGYLGSLIAPWLCDVENYMMEPMVDYKNEDVYDKIKDRLNEHEKIFGKKEEILKKLAEMEQKPPKDVSPQQLKEMKRRLDEILQQEPEKRTLLEILDLQSRLNDEVQKWNKSVDSWNAPLISKKDFDQRKEEFNASTDNGNPMNHFNDELNDLIRKTSKYFKENANMDPRLDAFLKDTLESIEAQSDVLPSKFEMCCGNMEHLSSAWQQFDDDEWKIKEFLSKFKKSLENADIQQQKSLVSQVPEIEDLIKQINNNFDKELKPYCDDGFVKAIKATMEDANTSIQNIAEQVINNIEKQEQGKALELQVAREAIIKDLSTNGTEIINEINKWFNELNNCVSECHELSPNNLSSLLSNLEDLDKSAPNIQKLIENGCQIVKDLEHQNTPERASELKHAFNELQNKLNISLTKELPKNKEDIKKIMDIMNNIEDGIKELNVFVEEGNQIKNNRDIVSDPLSLSNYEKEFLMKEADIKNSIEKDKELLNKLKELATNSSIQVDVAPVEERIAYKEKELKDILKDVEADLSATQKCNEACGNASRLLNEIATNLKDIEDYENDETSQKKAINAIKDLENDLQKAEDMIKDSQQKRNNEAKNLSKAKLDKIDNEIKGNQKIVDDIKKQLKTSTTSLGESIQKWNDFNDCVNVVEDELHKLSEELEQSHLDRNGNHGRDIDDKLSLLNENQKRLERLEEQEKEIEAIFYKANELNSEKPIGEVQKLKDDFHKQKECLEKEIISNRQDLEDHQQLQDKLNDFNDWMEEVEELNKEIQETPSSKDGLLKKQGLLEKLNSLKAAGTNKLQDLKKLQNKVVNETAPDSKDSINFEVERENERFHTIFGGLDNFNDDVTDSLSKLATLDEKCVEIFENIEDMSGQLEKSMTTPRNTLEEKRALEDELMSANGFIKKQADEINKLKKQSEGLNEEAKEEIMIKIEGMERDIEKARVHVDDQLSQNKTSIEKQSTLENSLKNLDSEIAEVEDNLHSHSEPTDTERGTAENLNRLQVLANEINEVEDRIIKIQRQRDEALPYLSTSEVSKINETIDSMCEKTNTLKNKQAEAKEILNKTLNKWNIFKENKEEVVNGLGNIKKEIEQSHKARKGVHGGTYDDKNTLLKENEIRLENLNAKEKEIQQMILLAEDLHSKELKEESEELMYACQNERKILEDEINCNRKDLGDHKNYQTQLNSFADWIKEADDLKKTIEETPNTKEGLLKKQKLLQKLNDLKSTGNKKVADLENLLKTVLNETSPDNKDEVSYEFSNECDRFNSIFEGLDDSNDDVNETILLLKNLEERCENLTKCSKNINDDLEGNMSDQRNTIADKEKFGKNLIHLNNDIEDKICEIRHLKDQSLGLNDEAKEEMMLKLDEIESDFIIAQRRVNEELVENKSSIDQQSNLEKSLTNIDSLINQLGKNVFQYSTPSNNKEDIQENLNQLEKLEEDFEAAEEMITQTRIKRDNAAPFISASELVKMDNEIKEMKGGVNDLKDQVTKSKNNLSKELNKWNIFNESRDAVKETLDKISTDLEQSHAIRKGIHGGNCDDKAKLLNENENRLKSLLDQEREVGNIISLARELNSNAALREAEELMKSCQQEQANLTKEIDRNQKDLEDHQNFNDELDSFRDWIIVAEKLNKDIENLPNTKEGLLKKQSMIEELNNLKSSGSNKLKDLKVLQSTIISETAPDSKDEIFSNVNVECERYNKIFGDLDTFNDDINKTISTLQTLDDRYSEITDNVKDLCNEFLKSIKHPRNKINDKENLEKELNNFNRFLDQQRCEVNEIKKEANILDEEANENILSKIALIERSINEIQQDVNDEVLKNKMSMNQQSEIEDKLSNLNEFINEFEERIAECSIPPDNENSVNENIRKIETLKSQLPQAKSLLEQIIKSRNQFDLPDNCLKLCDDTEQSFFDIEDTIINQEKAMEMMKNNWATFNTEKEDLEKWIDAISSEILKLNEKNQGIHGGKMEDKERVLEAHKNLLQDVINHEGEMQALIDRTTPLETSPNSNSPSRITNSLCKKYEKVMQTLTGVVQENQKDLEIHENFENEIDRFCSENNRIIKDLNEELSQQPNNKDGFKRQIELYNEIKKIHSQRAQVLPDLEKLKEEVIKRSSPKAFQSIEQLWDKVIENFDKSFSKTNENQSKLISTFESLEKNENDCDELQKRLSEINNAREVCLLAPVSSTVDLSTKLNTLKDIQYELTDLQSMVEQLSRKANEFPAIRDRIDKVKKDHKTLKEDICKDINQCENANKDLQNINIGIKNLKTWLDHNRTQFNEQKNIDNVDITSLKQKQSKLKILLDDIAEHKVDLSRLQSQMEPLLKLTHERTLKEVVEELSDDYKDLHDQCQNSIDKYDRLTKLTSKYEQSRASVLHWIDSNTQVLLKCSDYNMNNSQVRSKLIMVENLEKDLEISGQTKFIEATQNGEELTNELTGMGKNVIERQVKDLKSDWVEMCRQLNQLSNNLKNSASKSEAFKDIINSSSTWLSDMEHAGMPDSAVIDHACQRPVENRRKSAQIDRMKTLITEIERHRPEFEKLNNMASEMANPSFDLENSQIQTRFMKLQNHLKEKADKLEKQELDFEKVKQDIENVEKWIFQTSMQIINSNTDQNNNNSPTNLDMDSVLEQNNENIQSILDKEPEVQRIHDAALILLEGSVYQTSDATTTFKEDLEKMVYNFNNLKGSTENKKVQLIDSLDKWTNYQKILDSTKDFLNNDLQRWWLEKERSTSQTPFSNKSKENDLKEIEDIERKIIARKRNIEKAAQECEGIPSKITTALSRIQTPGLQSPLQRSRSSTPDIRILPRKSSLSMEQTIKSKEIFEELEENLAKLSTKKKEIQNQYVDWNNFNKEKSAFKNWFDNEVMKYKSVMKSSPRTTNIDAFQKKNLAQIQEEIKSKRPVLLNLINRFSNLNTDKPENQDPLLKDVFKEFDMIEKEISKILNREDKEVEADFTEDDSKADILQEVFVPKLALSTSKMPFSNGYKSPESLQRFTQTFTPKDDRNNEKQSSANFSGQTPLNKTTQTIYEDVGTDPVEISRASSRSSKKEKLSNITNKINEIRHELDKTKPRSSRRSSPVSLSSRRFRTPNQESVRKNMIPSPSRTPYYFNEIPGLELNSPSRSNPFTKHDLDDYVPSKNNWHDLELFLESTPTFSTRLPKSAPNREFQVSYQKPKKSKIYEDLDRLTRDSQDLRIMTERLKK